MLLRIAKKSLKFVGLAQMSTKESNKLVLAQVRIMLRSKVVSRSAVKKTRKLINTKTATKAVMASSCPKGWL
jgi:hypothetical protein